MVEPRAGGSGGVAVQAGSLCSSPKRLERRSWLSNYAFRWTSRKTRPKRDEHSSARSIRPRSFRDLLRAARIPRTSNLAEDSFARGHSKHSSSDYERMESNRVTEDRFERSEARDLDSRPSSSSCRLGKYANARTPVRSCKFMQQKGRGEAVRLARFRVSLSVSLGLRIHRSE